LREITTDVKNNRNTSKTPPACLKSAHEMSELENKATKWGKDR